MISAGSRPWLFTFHLFHKIMDSYKYRKILAIMLINQQIGKIPQLLSWLGVGVCVWESMSLSFPSSKIIQSLIN